MPLVLSTLLRIRFCAYRAILMRQRKALVVINTQRG